MRIAIIAAALILAACASDYPIEAPRQPPPAATPAPRPAPPPRTSSRDQCGAADLQHLVGRPRSDIPVPVEPGRQRVACTTCPVTQDYAPGRLNFFFDSGTGVIKEIRCG
ncbi:MAG: peptidase inhibitor I78 [Phenylobacterium sp.]